MIAQTLEQRIENMEADIREMKAMLAELVDVARGTGQPPQEEHIMSAREVADFLRIDVNLVYSKCSRGELPYSKLGKHYKFRKSDILDCMKQYDKGSGISVDDYVTRYLQDNQLRG